MHAQTCELTNLYVSRTGWASWHSSCQDAEVRVVLTTIDGTTLADSLTTDTTMQLPTTALVDKTLYHLSVTQTLSPSQTVDCEWFYASCSHLAMVTNAVAAPHPAGGVALRWNYPVITASATEAPCVITMFDGHVTDPGAMSDGSDASWKKGEQGTWGSKCDKGSSYWVGFPVVLDRPTTLSEIEVYSYQTGSTTTPTFTGLYVQIYNENPKYGGTVVWGDADAEVSNQGTLQNIQGNDNISHVTTATFDSANAGYDKVITLHYALTGTAQMLNNYTLGTTSEPYAELGAILEPMVPDTTGTGSDSTVADHGFDIYAYGYCTGSSYSLRYHLRSGNPDQYKIDFADIRFTDVDWTNLTVTGAEGTIDIDVPVDLPTGDYTMTVTFRDSRFPWIESSPITASFHVNLPADRHEHPRHRDQAEGRHQRVA